MEVQHGPGEFFIVINRKKALLNYRIVGKKMDIFYTFTDKELRGQGLAEKVTQAAFEYAKMNGLTVVPNCPYVLETFLAKHKEWEQIVER